MSGRSLISAVVGTAVGAFVWTATEYATHRWVLHGPFGKGRLKALPIGGLHRAHHRDPQHTSLPARTAGHLAVGAASAVVTLAAGSVAPRTATRAAGAAFTLGYSAYEINHWNAHHRPPRTAWGRRLRDRHHRHHYGAPGSNLGVTFGFWDRVFGTEAISQASGMSAPAEAETVAPVAADMVEQLHLR